MVTFFFLGVRGRGSNHWVKYAQLGMHAQNNRPVEADMLEKYGIDVLF